jgi:DNA-binding MarR family transcriptional regulator
MSRSERAPSAGESGAFYEALQALLRVYQFRDRDRACYGDLSVHDCYALEAVERAGELGVGGLAQQLGLHKSNASRIASSLARRGYVARTRDAADGRGVRLRLTPLGRARHAAVRRRVEREQAAILRAYPARTTKAFAALLRELARAAAERFGGDGRKRC